MTVTALIRLWSDILSTPCVKGGKPESADPKYNIHLCIWVTTSKNPKSVAASTHSKLPKPQKNM